MRQQPANHAEVTSDHSSTPGASASSDSDGLVAAVHYAHGGGAHIPTASSHSADTGGHPITNVDHADGSTDYVHGSAVVAGGLPIIDGTIEGLATNAGDVHTDQAHAIVSSVADFVDVSGIGQGLSIDPQYTVFEDNLNGVHFSALFDNLDTISIGFSNPPADAASFTPSGFSFSFNDTVPVGLPDVFSDAKGGSHGGNNGGNNGGTSSGGTGPSDFTTSTGSNLEFHVHYDSSVANAPSGFTTVVHDVADYFASELNAVSTVLSATININVGYGEVNGYSLGPGALGESMTQLQQVSLSDGALQNYYSANGSGLNLGSDPGGAHYVSFAEAKALGIAITDPGYTSTSADGYVGFSSQGHIFDYNHSNGVGSHQYDFYGVVAHEFSEVMGRLLLVGTNPFNTGPSYTIYDQFHYNSGGQDFTGDGGYFSPDLGVTNWGNFNNPSNGGDAGDWASGGTSVAPNNNGSSNDAFNAFGSPGQLAPVTNADLLALHAVGFELVHAVA